MDRRDLSPAETALDCLGPSPMHSMSTAVCPASTAIFESKPLVRRLFIALLGDSLNQSFVVYLFPDFFNSIAPVEVIPAVVAESV
jgi:hypothetical protein